MEAGNDGFPTGNSNIPRGPPFSGEPAVCFGGCNSED